MTSKERSAALVSKHVHGFRCPLCTSPMKVVDLKSILCLNNHTFDFARQGYVNMMNRSINTSYDKKLFEARHHIITESNLYTRMHEEIATIINDKMNNDEILILDAGCGEGSHLKKVLDGCKNEAKIGVGLDISREGIRMAASKYKEWIWLVGDLANAPLKDESCDVILNILSPANYQDFNRILTPNGLVVKVVPRSNYLKQLRQVLYEDEDKQFYTNAETVSLFQQHYRLVEVLELNYTKELTKTELTNLVQMSPLAWNMSEEECNRMVNKGHSEITVDLDVLIGIKE